MCVGVPRCWDAASAFHQIRKTSYRIGRALMQGAVGNILTMDTLAFHGVANRPGSLILFAPSNTKSYNPAAAAQE